MNTHFHAFVFGITLIVYIILRSYKKSNTDNHNTSNFIYVLLTPIILYGGHYYFYNTSYNQTNIIEPSITQSSVSENLLTTPYPVSSSDSLST